MSIIAVVAVFTMFAVGPPSRVQAPDGAESRNMLCRADGSSPTQVPPTKATPPTKARIDQLGWLGGNWVGTTDTGSFEERWTPPGGGVMLATARTLHGGVMRDFEFLCIVERNGGLVYQAMPSGRQPATDFTLTKIEGTSLTFENEQNSFPKMIRYTLTPDGTLEAVISGTGKQKPQTFRFKKQGN